MAGGSKGGSDMVLGGRHLVGIFALLVVVLGIVFTLGYLLGRSRYEDQARVAAASAATDPATAAAKNSALSSVSSGAATSAPSNASGRSETPPPANWDFYHSGEPAKTPDLLEPAKSSATSPVASAAPSPAPVPASVAAPQPKSVASPAPPPAKRTAAPQAASKPRAGGGSALIPQGAITLQVAALLREGDALELAQELQERKFPAIVTTPSTDKYYRVQVGPYPDSKSATAALHALEKQGFKPMVRR